MEVLWGSRVRLWLLVNGVMVLMLVLGWSWTMHTHLAGQEYPRTILAFEIIPVLALGASLITMSQSMPWILRGASRPHKVALLVVGALQIAPALSMPLMVIALLRTGLVDVGERDATTSLAELFPWSFPLSLLPTLMVCAAAGLVVEGCLGRGAGGVVPLIAHGAIVVWQSRGGASWLAGVPGGDDHLPWWSLPVALMVLTLALGVWLYQRAGARGLLASH